MKAVLGAAAIIGAAATFAVAPYLAPGIAEVLLSTAGSAIISGIGLMGVGMEVSALADLAKAGPSVSVTARQSAQPWRVIYGQSRVGGSLVFESTTGHQLNHVFIWASHACHSIDNIYLDSKRLYYTGSQGTNWGDANGNTYTNEKGNSYNFGGIVFTEHRYGWPGGYVRDNSGVLSPSRHFTSLEGNDPAWTDGHWLFGHCCSYVKCVFSASQFPSGQPSVKATIKGKCDIYDPRTGTSGYTTNAALCVADFMTNTTFGMGMPWSEIDIDELIASANVCDETRQLANGLTEPRFTCNGTFTTDSSRGDILSSMLDAMAGRTAFIGGKHKIIAGYDRGVSLSFDQDDLTGDVEWSSQRGSSGRFNEVQPVFICPTYPYQVVGNLYDAENPQPGVFDGEWQSTSAPPYSLSDVRGYGLYPLKDADGNAILTSTGTPELGDAFMAEDNGQRLTTDLKLQFVISAAQSQYLARIKLMRFRQMGSGTLPLKLSGLKTCALDNIQFTFAPFGWVDKELEVTGWRFVPKKGKDGSGILLETEIDVAETDPAETYYWSTEEELALNEADYLTIADGAQVESPTNLELESGLDSAVVTSDGIVHPRIRVTWTAPSDPLILSGGAIALQYQMNGDTWWLNGPALTGDATICYIPGVVQGQPYNVRIRSVRTNSSLGAWLLAGPHIVSETNSVITTASLNPNAPANTSNNATIDSIAENSAATIRVYGPGGDGSSWNRIMGSVTIAEPACHISGLAFATKFYVVYDVVNSVYMAYTSYLDTLSDNYYFIGEPTTCSSTYTGTGSGDGGGGTGGTGGGDGGGTSGGGGRTPIDLE